MESRLIGTKTAAPTATPVCFHHRSATRRSAPASRGLLRRRQLFATRASVAADRAALDITKMAPLGDRVLVKPFEAEDKTEGGILLPSSAADTGRDALFGEVLSVGEDVQMKIAKGDTVVFNMMSSAKVEVVDGDIVFVHDKNILAKLS